MAHTTFQDPYVLEHCNGYNHPDAVEGGEPADVTVSKVMSSPAKKTPRKTHGVHTK